MKRRWRVLIVVLGGLAVLLAINTVVTDNQTKQAKATVEGGQILELTSGDVQVLDEGPRRAQPIVLIHCFGCSLRWFDRLAPLLADEHRVIRLDVLGFGGSEKPPAGYTIPEQANVVAEVMGELGLQGAVVVGHSMGFDIASALAQSHSELVDRVVNIDKVPEPSLASPSFLASLGFVPVIGEALWRVIPDFAVKEGYGSAFAPGYDLEDGFDDPDQVVADYGAMTYTSYDEAASAMDDFAEEQPLDERIAAAAVPLLVIFGTEDQLADDPAAGAEAYRVVPGAEIELIEGAGHSPNVEDPEATAALIERFAAESHYVPPRAERLRAHQAKNQQSRRDHQRKQHGGRADRKGKNRHQ